MTSERRLAVVSAGLSQPSSTRLLGERLAAATTRALEQRGLEADVEIVELRDHARDITNNMLTGFPSPQLRAAIDELVAADALIAVTPIFNASYSGLFKSFFDVLEVDALRGKPVLAAATGGSARHSLALEHAMRPLFTYLRAIVVPTGVFAASQDWGSGRAVDGALVDRIEQAGRELAELVSERRVHGPLDPYDDPTPFADLLAQRRSD
jgi:FMN reductase